MSVVVSNTSTVVVDGKTPAVILSGQMGPPGSSALNNMQDIDLTNLEQDSLLIYDVSSQKWKASKKLESHLVNAGFF